MFPRRAALLSGLFGALLLELSPSFHFRPKQSLLVILVVCQLILLVLSHRRPPMFTLIRYQYVLLL